LSIGFGAFFRGNGERTAMADPLKGMAR